MNEKVKQAFKLLCEQYVKDLNRYESKEIAKDYFYNPKYECGFKIDGKNVYFADIIKAFDNMEELIKGKDEYIAKLCCDRAELKEENKTLKNIIYGKEQLIVSASKELTELKEHEKELIAEQHRLFDLAKEQENELKELREFARIVLTKGIDAPLIKEYPNITYVDYNMKSRFELGTYTKAEFDLVKKVVEKYGK